jgi:hypothetical protein
LGGVENRLYISYYQLVPGIVNGKRLFPAEANRKPNREKKRWGRSKM